jgi:hypothetical protein
MSAYLMQARSSSSGALISWTSSTPDFAGSSFPGPGLAEFVAVSAVNKSEGGGGGESVAPLSLVLYVDEDAPGDEELEDGSIAHPFQSVQDAIDAAFTGSTIVIVNATSAENLTITKSIVLAAARVFTRRPGGGYARAGTNVELGNITVTGDVFHILTLSGITCGTISGGPDALGTLNINDACDVGAITTAATDLRGSDSDFSGLITGCNSGMGFVDCRFSTSGTFITTAGTFIEMKGCSLGGTKNITFSGSAGTVRMDAISNHWWKAATESITNGSKVIIGDLSA